MKTTTKAPLVALLTLAFSLPAFAQERTLQDVARELKLKPKAERKGTFSAAESTVAQGDVGWETVYAANARGAEAQLQVATALAAQAAERAAAQPHVIVQTVDPRYYVGGGTPYVHPLHRHHVLIVAPAAPTRPAAPSVSRPSVSPGGRSHRRD